MRFAALYLTKGETMKAKYLIQLETKNGNMGATGWFSVSGAMTKAAALETLKDFEASKRPDDGRALRVISAGNFSKENRAANLASFNLNKRA